MPGDGDGDALMLDVLIQLIDINTVLCFQPFMLNQKMFLRLPSIQLLKKIKTNHAEIG